jgi:peptidoglycan/LPS O-acetylase OafA/YrhL
MTIGGKLLLAENRPSGFDYFRICLALSVALSHIGPIWFGPPAVEITGPIRPLFAFILPMFFALSGFLVAGSLLRTGNLGEFFGLRAIRLLPALFVEICLSALIIGPLFTSLSLAEYFSSQGFFSYFANIVGWIHYQLPGVFLNNPHPNVVNEQLWTIPWELDCYIALGVLAVLTFTRRPWLFLSVVVICHAVAIIRYGWKPLDGWVSVKGHILVLSFLVGVTFYLFKDRIIWSWPLFAASSIAFYAALLIPHGDLVCTLPATYATVFLGVCDPTRNRIVLSGDYSYGLYLYGFPIQQAFASIWPGANLSIVFAMIIAFAFAAMSWWCIEKPAIKLRKLLPRGDRLAGHLDGDVAYRSFQRPARGRL